MFTEKIELCDGIVAIFNEERNVYICCAAWLGRDIEICLSAGDYDDESEMDNLKRTFEKFWNERADLLKASQNDIREKVIPYIASKRAAKKYSTFPDVSVDDFDADYWLTSVYVLSGFDEDFGEIQMNFYKNANEDIFDCFFVSRDLNNGYLTFYVDGEIITDDI
ncbi:MAG: hypothetical protein IKY04_07585 [Lachnospiraceae bacterium]|nr:hypothetical protein [Lachnospiraceae bacterium]